MKTNKNLGLVIMLFAILACNKSPDPGNICTLNSIINPDPIYTNGFSFELGKSVNYPLETDKMPDFLLNDRYDTTVNILVGAAFVGYDFPAKHFYLYSDYKESNKALKAYKRITKVKSVELLNQTSDLNANQIWIYKGKDDTYGKILILSVKLREGKTQRYSEVTFRWDKI